MSISIPTEPVYRPCYYYDSSTGKMALGQYNYTEMLEKLAAAPERHDITYWVPDEYGRVLIDPKHPWQASLESEDASDIRLPSSCLSGLPAVGNSRTERRHAEQEKERKLQEERLRLFREERERTARQEVLLHRLTQSILTACG